LYAIRLAKERDREIENFPLGNAWFLRRQRRT
jgi:hypothetical protein